jgi:hypothetical protein
MTFKGLEKLLQLKTKDTIYLTASNAVRSNGKINDCMEQKISV